MRSGAGDRSDALAQVMLRIHAQRLRWLSRLERRADTSGDSADDAVFPRSRTLRFVIAHRKSLVLGLGAVMLLRRGWSGRLGMLLLQRFARR